MPDNVCEHSETLYKQLSTPIEKASFYRQNKIKYEALGSSTEYGFEEVAAVPI